MNSIIIVYLEIFYKLPSDGNGFIMYFLYAIILTKVISFVTGYDIFNVIC